MRQQGKLCLGDRGMFLWIVAEIPEPDEHPDEAERADGDERAAPIDGRHKSGHQQRRRRIAEPREGMGDALRETALLGFHPMLHRARGGGQRRADAKPISTRSMNSE